jgi:hypothetical protein
MPNFVRLYRRHVRPRFSRSISVLCVAHEGLACARASVMRTQLPQTSGGLFVSPCPVAGLPTMLAS